MSWYTTEYQLVWDGIPNASFHVTSPQQSQRQISETTSSDSVTAINHRKLRAGNQKISTFRIPLFGVPASYKLDEQSLCIYAFHYWQAQVFPGIYPCANCLHRIPQ